MKNKVGELLANQGFIPDSIDHTTLSDDILIKLLYQLVEGTSLYACRNEEGDFDYFVYAGSHKQATFKIAKIRENTSWHKEQLWIIRKPPHELHETLAYHNVDVGIIHIPSLVQDEYLGRMLEYYGLITFINGVPTPSRNWWACNR